MRFGSLVQHFSIIPTALFAGIFVIDRNYFITHHLLSIFAITVTTFYEIRLLYSTKNGKITLRSTLISNIVLLLMLITTIYIDYNLNRIFAYLH